MAVDGDFAGNLLLVGRGAGAGATASAVVSDIVDIARGTSPAPFLVPAGKLKPYKRAKLGQHQGAYYVRLAVFDRPGAMAGIAGRLGEREVSLESIVQRRPRGAQIGIGAKLEAGRAHAGHPHHARDHRGSHSRRPDGDPARRQRIGKAANDSHRAAIRGSKPRGAKGVS